jgi:GntR family transcriptional regulator, rspAB operon transcriptional repressor
MPAQTLTPLTSPISLEKFAYDALKDAIVSFRFTPGQSLVETDLARQLNISKTPVRDALLRLEKEGFVTKVPYTGYYVMEITPQSVKEMFEIQAVLEGLAARQAALQFNQKDKLHAISLIHAHNQALFASQMQDASALNREFHDLILQRAGNQRLQAMLQNLDDHLQRYRTLSNYQSGRLMKSVEEHQRVLDAILNQDPQEAENTMRAHILSVLEDLESQDFQELIALAHATAGSGE